MLDPARLIARCRRRPTRSSSHHAVADYVVRLVLATRDPARVRPAGDRAAARATAPAPAPPSAWSPPARALALLRGRDYVLPDDVRDLAAGRARATGWCSPSTRSPTGSTAETAASGPPPGLACDRPVPADPLASRDPQARRDRDAAAPGDRLSRAPDASERRADDRPAGAADSRAPRSTPTAGT